MVEDSLLLKTPSWCSLSHECAFPFHLDYLIHDYQLPLQATNILISFCKSVHHFKNNSLFLDVWHLDLEAVSDDEFRARQKQGEASKLIFLVKANIHVRFSRKFFIFDLRKWEKLG